LLPHLAALRIEQVLAQGRVVWLHASVVAPDAACPGCGTRSGRVHSRYERSISDPAIGGQETLIRLRIRRFFCDNCECPRKTFAEQVPGVTVPHARRTPLLRGILETIALALGGRPGARLTRQLAIEVSRMTLLRLIRALPVPEPGTLAVLGIDDFAFRKSHNYGSIVVDMHTHRPVDLLPDRLADTFADWLRAHPGTEVICRDRAGGYAEGARLGAPEAIQVADRFHLLYNLTDAVDRVVRAHRKCLQDRSEHEAVAQPAPPAVVAEGRRAELTRQRHAEVHALWDKGIGTTTIAKALNLDDKTVRRYARAATADELLTELARRGSELDAHTGYLAQRWQEGCTNAARLDKELRVSAATVAANGPCVGYSRPGAAARPHQRPPRRQHPSPGRSPDGSSVRQPTALSRNKPTSPAYSTAVSPCGLSTSSSAISPECSANAAASTWTPGSPKPRPATFHRSRGSRPACSKTTMLSGMDSPSPGAAAQSRELYAN
jgi:transposase